MFPLNFAGKNATQSANDSFTLDHIHSGRRVETLQSNGLEPRHVNATDDDHRNWTSFADDSKLGTFSVADDVNWTTIWSGDADYLKYNSTFDLNDDRLRVTTTSLANHKRRKRGVFNLGSMVDCATSCHPLRYAGYGCFCGYLGSGRAVDGIDR